jgi:hypothetical protein
LITSGVDVSVVECTVEEFVPDKNKGPGKAGRGVGKTAEDIKSREKETEIV